MLLENASHWWGKHDQGKQIIDREKSKEKGLIELLHYKDIHNKIYNNNCNIIGVSLSKSHTGDYDLLPYKHSSLARLI
jgi:hypothetical protein